MATAGLQGITIWYTPIQFETLFCYIVIFFTAVQGIYIFIYKYHLVTRDSR